MQKRILFLNLLAGGADVNMQDEEGRKADDVTDDPIIRAAIQKQRQANMRASRMNDASDVSGAATGAASEDL